MKAFPDRGRGALLISSMASPTIHSVHFSTFFDVCFLQSIMSAFDDDRWKWDCDACAPPIFDLPPPPPPPWMKDECGGEDSWRDRLETCDSLAVSASVSPLEEALHSAAVAVVASLVLVLLFLLVALAVFRSVQRLHRVGDSPFVV